MDRLLNLRRWLDARRAYAYPAIRAFLGLALFVRGWLFIADSEAAVRLVTDRGGDWIGPIAIVHYVALAHLVGGLMLAGGLFTRVAVLVQLPILIGATFFIHFQEGLLSAGQSLELSALVLFLLIVFLLFGSGPISLDRYLIDRTEEPAEHHPAPA